MRKLRNRLVHEYMEDEEGFAKDLMLAKKYSFLLVDCFNRVCDFATTWMDLDKKRIPQKLVISSE